MKVCRTVTSDKERKKEAIAESVLLTAAILAEDCCKINNVTACFVKERKNVRKPLLLTAGKAHTAQSALHCKRHADPPSAL